MLVRRQYELEYAFKDIRKLRDQDHKHRVVYDQLREESSYWVGRCRHLEGLLDQMEMFIQDLIRVEIIS